MSTREQILEAVKDEDWQEFRLAMKGKTTAAKLSMLRKYYKEGEFHFLQGGRCYHADCNLNIDAAEFERYKIRIDNYIKALCRGGQLYAGESLETALMAKPIFIGLRIKR